MLTHWLPLPVHPTDRLPARPPRPAPAPAPHAQIVLPLMYFNEHELLEAKLEEAYDVADLFGVAASPRSHPRC